MYQFSPATDRILRIRQRIRDRVIQQDAERAEIATEAYKQYQHIVPIIRRPLITLEVCKKIYEDAPAGSELSWDYQNENFPVLEAQLRKAGYRLARLLTEIYE